MRRVMFCFIVCLAGVPANAQDNSPSFINPFKALSLPPAERDQPKTGFFPKITMPKLPVLPKLPSLPRIPSLNPFAKKQVTPQITPARPNLFQQMGSGTKRFFDKTANALTPWHKPKADPQKTAIVPAFMQKRTISDQKPTRVATKPWFSPTPETKKIETPSDFFRQERLSLPPIMAIPEK